MVKSIKYIFTRIIIGVGIAIILMLLKGGLIGNVYAESKNFVLTSSNKTSCIYPPDCSYYNGVTGNMWNGNTASNSIAINYRIPNNVEAGFYKVNYIVESYVRSACMSTSNGTGVGCLYNSNSINNLRLRTYDENGNFLFLYYGSVNPNGGGGSWSFLATHTDVYIEPGYSIRITVNYQSFDNVSTRYGSQGSSQDISFIYDENTNSMSGIKESQDKTNELLEDDSVDNDKAEDDIDDMKDKVASNGTITQLLTLPITLYRSILNSIGGSCSSFNLGNLYNHSLIMPCINLQNLLGSTLYNIIDIMCCGAFILVFRKKMVDIFNHMTSLNDKGNEVE